MQRKLIPQGIGGFTVYLPKKWIKKKNLEEGSKVSIEEIGPNLIIRSSATSKKTIKIIIDDEKRQFIRVILSHLYRKGFDVIYMQGINSSDLIEIKKVVQDLLLGFGIIEQDNNKVVLSNISEPREEKINSLMRRIFLIIKESINLTKQDLSNGVYNSKKEVEQFRWELDKYIWFVRRVLIKEPNDIDPVIMWDITGRLYFIAHSVYYLYLAADTTKTKANKEMKNLMDEMISYFDLFYAAYFKKDYKKVLKMQSLKSKYHYGDCYDLLENSKGKDSIVASHIRETFRLLQTAGSPLLSDLIPIGEI